MWSRRLDQRKRWRSISYILLEWIIQSLSHAAVNHPPKGACFSVHRSTLIRGEPDISPHRQIKACLPTASHPLLPLFTRVCVCGVCVWFCLFNPFFMQSKLAGKVTFFSLRNCDGRCSFLVANNVSTM